MRYFSRVLLGLLLIAGSFGLLYYGSPARTPGTHPADSYIYGFLGLFAVGFILISMGLLGAEDDYPALLSGFVLYFMLGGLIAVFIYVSSGSISGYSLADAGDAGFWGNAGKVAARWPYEMVVRAGVFGYSEYR